jgi:hypothetical protein
MEREIFFFPFLLSLQITKIHFYPLEMGAKMEEKKSLSVDCPFDRQKGAKCHKMVV